MALTCSFELQLGDLVFHRSNHFGGMLEKSRNPS